MGKKPLKTTRRSWEDNLEMDLKEIGVYVMNSVASAQKEDIRRPTVNAASNLRVGLPISLLIVSCN